MSDRPAGTRSSSERTDNEISGGSRVGGNAYQARTIRFGGRSVGLTLVSLALVAALAGVVVVVVERGGGTKEQPAAGPTAAAAVPVNAPSPGPTPSPTPPQTAPSASAPAAPGPQPEKSATGSLAFKGANLYCGGWQSSRQSANLRVASCVQVDPAHSSATFGVMVKNVGKTQVVARALVQTAGLGGSPECPQGRYSPGTLRIDPGRIWFSDLGRCSVGRLENKDFQTLGAAIEDPDGTGDVQQGGAVYSAHVWVGDGQVKCKIGELWTTSCASFAYPPKD
ncbi:hypothetical protein [Streptomyces katrae]|uniref:hypothetical protein n=1 Tax=Streptomyces katrae TaxID=68223 RepID=UPI000AF9C046|nr:hypothetical protein [Streptomyces katrae]